MAAAMAMFEGAGIDERGGQMVWKYVGQFGTMTFRFDIPGGHINTEGFMDGVFGHAWDFAEVLREIAAFAEGK